MNGGILAAPGQGPQRPLVYKSQTRQVGRFGLGLAGSGFACGIGLLLFLVLQPQGAPIATEPLATPEATAAVATQPAPPAGVLGPTVFDLAFSRSERARAPFPLRVAGAAGEDMRVILRDVPVAAWLSRGERKDEHTWSLRLSDLKDLHLTLNEGTPDTFEMVMDVVGPPGTLAVPTVARVRLLDPPPGRRAAATIDDLLANPTGAPGRASQGGMVVASDGGRSAVRGPVVGGDKAAALPRAPEARAAPILAETGKPPPQQARARWPEGASALGAMAREPGARQVWWSMPTAWSPFPDMLGRP